MTTYTAILDTQVDPDAPITSGLGYQFRDNPIAIAEGAAGAPRIARKHISGRGAPVTFTSIGSYTGAELNIFVDDGGDASASLSIALSDDGGSSFYAATSLPTVTTNDPAHHVGFIDFVTGQIRFISNDGSVTQTVATLAGASVNVDAFRLSGSPGDTVSAYGTLNGGTTTV